MGPLLLLLIASGGAKDAVAVLPITVGPQAGVRAGDAGKFTGLLDASVGATGFKTIARSEVQTAIAELKAQSYRECYDEACQIELGKSIAAQKVVISAWARIGGSCTFTLKLYELRTSLAQASIVLEQPCTEQGLRAAITQATETLADRVSGTTAAVVRRAETLDFGGAVKNVRPNERGFLVVRAKTAAVAGDTGDSDQWVEARVYVDRGDRPAGTTRGELGWSSSQPLVAGVHRVTVIYRESDWAPGQQDVTVRDGETADVTLVLEPRFGLLDVVTRPPAATAEVDGAPLPGVTPLSAVRVPAGRIALVLAAPDHLPHQETLRVRPGERRRYERALDPDFGALEVTTDPPGARVVVDGRDTGRQTPARFERFPSGRHEVNVERDGYAPAARTVELPRGGRAQVEVALAPYLGSLVVRAPLVTTTGDTPDCRAEAQLRRGDHIVGSKTTPAIFRDLVATEHRVDVVCQGVTQSRAIRVAHNQELDVEIRTDDAQVRAQRRAEAEAREAQEAERERLAEEAAAGRALLRKRLVGRWYGHNNSLLVAIINETKDEEGGLFGDESSLAEIVAAPFVQLMAGIFSYGLGIIPLDIEAGAEIAAGGVTPTLATRLRLQWLQLVVRGLFPVGEPAPARGLDFEAGVTFFDGLLLAPYLHWGHRWRRGEMALEPRGSFIALGNRFSVDLSSHLSIGLPIDVAVPLTGDEAPALRLALDFRYQCCAPPPPPRASNDAR